jgi:hypothetical protein
MDRFGAIDEENVTRVFSLRGQQNYALTTLR